MNYLAHAYLSGENEELIVGNFIADHLRGNNFDHLPDGVIKGIRLHREIDSFTDAHPLFKASKRLFYDGFEKHSGILVDIYFDHLLARSFDIYHSQGLDQFSRKVYQIYQKHEELLPPGSRRFLEYVIRNQIFQNYSRIEGIRTVLSHLSHRIGHGISLDQSVPLFHESEVQFSKNFEFFFDELQAKTTGYNI